MPEIKPGGERFVIIDQLEDLFSLMEKTAGAEPEPRSGSDMGRVVRTYYREGVQRDKVAAYSIDLNLSKSDSGEILTVFPDEVELMKFVNDIPPFFSPYNLDKTVLAVISKKTGPGLEETYRTPNFKELSQVKDFLTKHPDNLVNQL